MTLTASKRIDFRIQEDKKAVIEEAAKLEGSTLSEFIKRVSYSRAVEVVNQHARLSDFDAKAFVRALIDPPEPNVALKRAFKRSA